MKYVHRTVSIYPETDEILTEQLNKHGTKKIMLVDLAIKFYLKYKHLEDKLKEME